MSSGFSYLFTDDMILRNSRSRMAASHCALTGNNGSQGKSAASSRRMPWQSAAVVVHAALACDVGAMWEHRGKNRSLRDRLEQKVHDDQRIAQALAGELGFEPRLTE